MGYSFYNSPYRCPCMVECRIDIDYCKETIPLCVTICTDVLIETEMDRDATVGCGITTPTTDCPYFYKELECPSGGSLAFLIYCTGGFNWTLEVYCLEDACYVLQSSSAQFYDRCNGMAFSASFTFDGECDCCACSGDCCPTLCDTSGEEPVCPSLTIDVVSSCAYLDGSGTLDPAGDGYTWEGFGIGPHLTVTLACDVVTKCWTLEMTGNFQDCFVSTGMIPDSVTCEPFDAVFTATFTSGGDCEECPAGTTITVTITE